MTAPVAPAKLNIPHTAVCRALSAPARWHILRVLSASEPTAPSDLAKKVGLGRSGVSKHLRVLIRCGMIQRIYRTHYRIPPQARVEGQNALDYGSIAIRLDGVN